MRMLSSQNTRKSEKLIVRAAAVQFGRGKGRPHFEHGQWWLILDDDDAESGEAIYSVVDSEPSIANTGLSFEQVS